MNWIGSLAVRSTEIGVGVKDGIVTLSGVVDSHSAKRSAERAAARVRGVRALSSQLEVKPVGTAGRTDADIAWAASNALAWNAQVPQDRISVSVAQGWITLEGSVERRFQMGVTNLIALPPFQRES